eukprot:5653004-Amphidinium_carterae.1
MQTAHHEGHQLAIAAAWLLLSTSWFSCLLHPKDQLSAVDPFHRLRKHQKLETTTAASSVYSLASW